MCGRHVRSPSVRKSAPGQPYTDKAEAEEGERRGLRCVGSHFGPLRARPAHESHTLRVARTLESEEIPGAALPHSTEVTINNRGGGWAFQR